MNEAELVYSHVLNCDRLSLYLNKDSRIDKNKSAQVSRILKRRIMGEPLQYIIGATEFMGLEFKVDKRALIPRPETEILVEAALEQLRAMGKISPKVLDLGTGSGCIAVSIAKLFPRAIIWASDISSQALELAKKNAGLHNVKIKFLQADLFSTEKIKKEQFDLIISNPPYVVTGQLSSLPVELSFEPPLALEAGIDGLNFYRRIIRQAAIHLNDDGLLALEVGADQAQPIKVMLAKENFSDIRIIKDYNGIKRVVMAKKRILSDG
jgi:release factor glutamine methyltransferase